MTKTRNRLSKNHDIPTGLKNMEGRRETLQRWRYYDEVRQLNFIIGATYLFEQILNKDKDNGN